MYTRAHAGTSTVRVSLELICRPNHAHENRVWWANSWSSKLIIHVTICIDLYWRTWGCTGPRKPLALWWPFLSLRVGAGNETKCRWQRAVRAYTWSKVTICWSRVPYITGRMHTKLPDIYRMQDSHRNVSLEPYLQLFCNFCTNLPPLVLKARHLSGSAFCWD